MSSSSTSPTLPLTFQSELSHFLASLNFDVLSQCLDECNACLDTDETESMDNASPAPEIGTPIGKLLLSPGKKKFVDIAQVSHPLLSTQFNHHLSSYVTLTESFLTYLQNTYPTLLAFLTDLSSESWNPSHDISSLWMLEGNILQESWHKIGLLRMSAERVLISLSATFYSQYNEYLENDERHTVYSASPASSNGLGSLLSATIRNDDAPQTGAFSLNDSALSGVSSCVTYDLSLEKMGGLLSPRKRSASPRGKGFSIHTRPSFTLEYKWKYRIEIIVTILSSSFWLATGITQAYKILRSRPGEARPLYRFLYNLVRFSQVLQAFKALTFRSCFHEGHRLVRALMTLCWTGAGISLANAALIRLLMNLRWTQKHFRVPTVKRSKSARRLGSYHNLGSLLMDEPPLIASPEPKLGASPMVNRNGGMYSPIHSLRGLLTSPTNKKFSAADECSSEKHEESANLDEDAPPEIDLTTPQDEEELKKESFTKVFNALKHHIDLMDRMERVLRHLNERILFHDALWDTAMTLSSLSSRDAESKQHVGGSDTTKQKELLEERLQASFVRSKKDVAQFSDFLKQYAVAGR